MRQCRPQFHMFLQCNMLECSRGIDDAYDLALDEFFKPYHAFIDLLMRVSVNQGIVIDKVIKLNVMVACEGVPLHIPLFAKLWYEMSQTENVDRRFLTLLHSSQLVVEYIDSVMLEERASLNNQYIQQFFNSFFPKLAEQVLLDNGDSLWENILQSLSLNRHELERAISGTERNVQSTLFRLNGDMRALVLIVRAQQHTPSELIQQLAYLNHVCREMMRERAAARHKAREEVERRERLVRERRERERKAASTAGEEPTPQQDTETGGNEVPKKRRKTSDCDEQTTPQCGNHATPATPATTTASQHTSSSQQAVAAAHSSNTVLESDSGDVVSDEPSPTSDKSAAAQVADRPVTSDTVMDTVTSETVMDTDGEAVKTDAAQVAASSEDKKSEKSETSSSESRRLSESETVAGLSESGSKGSSSCSSSCASSSAGGSLAGTFKASDSDSKTEQAAANKEKKAVKKRVTPKERPTLLDHVTRHIENVFALLNPSSK